MVIVANKAGENQVVDYGMWCQEDLQLPEPHCVSLTKGLPILSLKCQLCKIIHLIISKGFSTHLKFWDLLERKPTTIFAFLFNLLST